MYSLQLHPAILAVIQRAMDFSHGLRRADPGIWDQFDSPEIAQIVAEWKLIPPQAYEQKECRLDGPLTASQMRSLARAMTVFIAAHDGRYSLLLDILSPVVESHPNPFTLRVALSDAETVRLEQKTSGGIPGLSAEEERQVRNLASGLGDAFRSPGQVSAPDLEALGIHFVDQLAQLSV